MDDHSLRVRLDLMEIDDFLKTKKIEMSLDFGSIFSQKIRFTCEASSEFSLTSEFKHQIESKEFKISIFFPEVSLLELKRLAQFPTNKKSLKKSFLCENFKGIDRVDLELDAFSISKTTKSQTEFNESLP
jgi:hypothetical protein